MSSHENHRQFRIDILDFAQDHQTIFIGKNVVQKYQIPLLILQVPHRLFSGARIFQNDTFILETDLQEATNERVILDDQNSFFAHTQSLSI